MKEKSSVIALILCRALSIYAIIRGIDNLSYNLLIYSYPEQYPHVGLVQLVGPTCVLMICGIILWIAAPRISPWVIRDSMTEAESNISLSDGLSQIVFAGVGLFIIVDTIPFLTYRLGHSILLQSSKYDARWVLAENAVLLGSSIIRLLLGGWLVVGSGKVAKMLKRINGSESGMRD